MMDQNFIWLDLETTGLDPNSNQILEIAAVATNSKLEELGRFHKILHFPKPFIPNLSDVVQKMHTDNGLFEECQQSQVFTSDVSQEMSNWVSKFGDKPILAGNTVHFDKSFVKIHLPDVDKHLHYRILDISTIKEMLRNFYNFKINKVDGNHRAISDVYASIEEFRKYLSILKLDMYGW